MKQESTTLTFFASLHMNRRPSLKEYTPHTQSLPGWILSMRKAAKITQKSTP
jgi:hypothetical protein